MGARHSGHGGLHGYVLPAAVVVAGGGSTSGGGGGGGGGGSISIGNVLRLLLRVL